MKGKFFMNYYIRAFQNYVNFSGRDSRKQYWMFVLFNIIVSFVISFVAGLVLGDAGTYVGYVYDLAILLPSIAIAIRRMHDIGKSGFWILICLIPLIGVIWYLVLMCKAGDEGENQYGPVPEE